jgi:hypothetical protein
MAFELDRKVNEAPRSPVGRDFGFTPTSSRVSRRRRIKRLELFCLKCHSFLIFLFPRVQAKSKKTEVEVNMKFGVNALIVILLICLDIVLPVHAEVEYNVLKTYKLEDQPVDMVFSASRNEIYVLNQKGELLIYNINGQLTEKINVGKVYDRLQLVQGSDILFLSSRKDKTIQIIQLDFVQSINTLGSPFKGPENSPVIIVVFSEFQ